MNIAVILFNSVKIDEMNGFQSWDKDFEDIATNYSFSIHQLWRKKKQLLVYNFDVGQQKQN